MTFNILFQINIFLLLGLAFFLALVYLAKLIDMLIENCKYELYWLRTINLWICDMSANIVIAIPFIIVLFDFIGIILILV